MNTVIDLDEMCASSVKVTKIGSTDEENVDTTIPKNSFLVPFSKAIASVSDTGEIRIWEACMFFITTSIFTFLSENGQHVYVVFVFSSSETEV